MSSIDEKIARAKEAQAVNRPHRDISVTLDAGLSAERDELEEEREALNEERSRLLKPDDQRLGFDPDTSEIDKRLKALDKKLQDVGARELDTLITIRLYRLPGDAWNELTVRNPMREGAQFDERFGYNIHGVVKQAVESFGRLLEGDAEQTLTPDQWGEIWPILGGAEFAAIADLVYAQNVLEPAARSARLKNSYEAATASAKK